MKFIDYYKTLGLDKKASEKEIKKAYRKMARKYHPDLNPNDKDAEKKFKQINEANEVLSNPENRKKYDKYGKDWKHAEEFEKANQQRQQQNQQRTYRNGGASSYSDDDFSDFFSSMFGGARSGSQSNVKFKGQDYHAELQLDLSDIYESHKRTLTVNGKNIRLTIPAGVKDQQVINIKGHGGDGINGGEKGNLYIKFIIHNDTPFKRDGNNLYLTHDLDLYTAVLGGDITIPTMNGKVKLKVKPETQNGLKVKLKGKGFPVYKKNNHGDLYVTYNIKIPTKLSDQEKELFKQLAKLR